MVGEPVKRPNPRARVNLPRFAPIYRDPNVCRNLRFSRLGDCDSFDVCEGSTNPQVRPFHGFLAFDVCSPRKGWVQ